MEWIRWNCCTCGEGGATNVCYDKPIITGPWFSFYVYSRAGLSYLIQSLNSPTSWAASGLPAGITINTSTGELVATDIIAATGWYHAEIVAYNACGYDDRFFDIQVIAQPEDVQCDMTTISFSDSFGSTGVYCGDHCSELRIYDVTGQFTATTTIRLTTNLSSGIIAVAWAENGSWYPYFETTVGGGPYYFSVNAGTTQLSISTSSITDWSAGSFLFECLPAPP